MKFPTIKVGMPYGSLRMVNEKQQSMTSCSFAGGSGSLVPCSWSEFGAGVTDPDVGSTGLKRSWHVVRTAFWFWSNATAPYFFLLFFSCPSESWTERWSSGETHLPVIDGRVFCHQLVDA